MSTSRGETALAVAVVGLFLVVRFILLVVREPFFDELFTVWLANKPLGEILPALTLDSGPPLYYFLARIPNVFALRVLSLVFSTLTLTLILTRNSLGTGRWIAATLLALYPPAALFAVDARAYALCGLFVAIGSVAVHEKRPFVAAGAFLLAAYTHWYGALFLPLVLLVKPRSRAFAALAIASILFAPGLWLASIQPAEATRWLSGQHPFAALNAFAFAGNYAESLFQPAPVFVIVLSAIALVVAGARSWSFAPMVLVPLLLAIAFALAGRTVYFPMRFESVIAVPLVLWLARSLQWWRREARYALAAVLAICGAHAIVRGALDHHRRPLDPYREAAMVVARGNTPIVASGFLYLETVHQLGESRVRAYPSEQGRHPGWRVSGLTREPLPPGPFLWIGERAAPELAMIRRRGGEVLSVNERAMIVRVR
ncbi:MAG TPA: hypothetical protein VE974_03570 [Thermoanaerobaculia bacterium]|nr:hypothetical protein [Thermoanaerobaculia bacterium]